MGPYELIDWVSFATNTPRVAGRADRTAGRSERLEPHPGSGRLAPGVRRCRVVTWLSPQPPQPIQEALPAIFNRIATHDPSP
jgi:hypothetical protein